MRKKQSEFLYINHVEVLCRGRACLSKQLAPPSTAIAGGIVRFLWLMCFFVIVSSEISEYCVKFVDFVLLTASTNLRAGSVLLRNLSSITSIDLARWFHYVCERGGAEEKVVL